MIFSEVYFKAVIATYVYDSYRHEKIIMITMYLEWSV